VDVIGIARLLREQLHQLPAAHALAHEIVTDPERLAAAMRFIVDGVIAGALRPIIAKVFPFEQIVDAHRFLESNAQFGKVVAAV
jgi:NADPH:quinone reductase-like Zn-dependent oxidoreductase